MFTNWLYGPSAVVEQLHGALETKTFDLTANAAKTNEIFEGFLVFY